MRLVLNSHPRIGVPTETEYFPRVWERFAQSPSQWREAVELFVRQCNDRLLPAVDLGEARSELLALAQPDYARLLALPLATWATADGKARWGEKTPFHIFHADTIVRLFPDAKVVVMLRDPRSAVASMNRFPAIASGTALNAWLWRDVYTRGLATVERFVPEGQHLTVRYEALLADPEAVIRSVCGFVDEPFTPALLTFHESTETYDSAHHTPKVARPIHGDPAEWRSLLSDSDVAIVEAVCGPLMTRLGYPREGRPPQARERIAIATYRAYRAVKHLQHRDARYHPVVYAPRTPFRGH